MENHIPTQNSVETYNECLICWDPIDARKYVKCINCKIVLHDSCESRDRNEKRYCKCPHCQRIGTLCLEVMEENFDSLRSSTFSDYIPKALAEGINEDSSKEFIN